MDEEQKTVDDSAAQNLGQSSSSMPPILTPEEFMAEVGSADNETAPITTANISESSSNEVPEPQMQGFAPMPSIPDVNIVKSVESKPQGVPREPVVSAPANPAMVPDPLYQNSISGVPKSTVDGGIIIPHQSEEYTHRNDPKKPNKLLKYLVWLSMALLTLGLSLGVFFGYRAYITNKRLETLQVALRSLVDLPAFSSKIEASVNQEKNNLTYEVDGDGNERLTADINNFPNSIIYLKDKDVLYVGDYSKIGTKSYYQYTNAFKSYSSLANKPLLFPDKEKLTNMDNLKQLQYVGTESVGDKKTYHFSIQLVSDQVSEVINNSVGINSPFAYSPSGGTVIIDILVDATAKKVAKIGLTSDVQLSALAGKEHDVFGVVFPGSINTSIVYSQVFDYGLNGNIKLPIGAKMSSTQDAAKALDDNFGQGATNMAIDKGNMAVVNTIVKAIEMYHEDNGDYPEANSISGLVSVLSQGEKQYLASDLDATAIVYTYDIPTKKYLVSYKLNYQDATGINIVGAAPNKYYQLGN